MTIEELEELVRSAEAIRDPESVEPARLLLDLWKAVEQFEPQHSDDGFVCNKFFVKDGVAGQCDCWVADEYAPVAAALHALKEYRP